MVNEFTVIDNLTIRTNDRVSIFGRTGSGKTFLAKNYLLPQYEKFVFYDVKLENSDMLDNKQVDIILHTTNKLKKELESRKCNKILYQPEEPTADDFNEICRLIFKEKDNALYVDEASIVTTPASIQYWHNVIMTQGRSYNVGIINTSQRPRIIHNTLISESEHLFVLSLNLETDISKIRQQVGTAANEIRYLPEYHTLYHNVRTGKSVIFKPVRPLGLEADKPKEPQKLELYRPSLIDYITLIDQRGGY